MTVAAIDTGGTFTDLAARAPDGSVVRLKTPSTPDDPSRAIVTVLGELRAELSRRGLATYIASVRHGTTVATNALLERRGGRVVLITNLGLEDILALRRQNRPDLYALHPTLPEPLVPRERTLGIRGRLDPSGAEVEP